MSPSQMELYGRTIVEQHSARTLHSRHSSSTARIPRLASMLAAMMYCSRGSTFVSVLSDSSYAGSSHNVRRQFTHDHT